MSSAKSTADMMVFPFLLDLMKVYIHWLKEVKDGLESFHICWIIALTHSVN